MLGALRPTPGLTERLAATPVALPPDQPGRAYRGALLGKAQAVAPQAQGVQDDPPQLVLHLPDRGLGGGHDRLDRHTGLDRIQPAVAHKAVRLGPHPQRGGTGLHATADEATDGRALEGEALVDGTDAEGSAGADATCSDVAGGELRVRVPCHGPQCSRPPRLG
jgi:hypothetical protein